MTNKLRSVIEDAIRDYIHTVPEIRPSKKFKYPEKIKVITTHILDAIIEEIPSIPDYDFLDASKSTEEKMLEGAEKLGMHKYRQSFLNKLKQAREELSTSLTQ